MLNNYSQTTLDSCFLSNKTSGMLGFGVVLPRLARDLFLACMAGIFMVLARETYVKLLAFAVIPFSLLPCAWLLTHLSNVTCLCNRTLPCPALPCPAPTC